MAGLPKMASTPGEGQLAGQVRVNQLARWRSTSWQGKGKPAGMAKINQLARRRLTSWLREGQLAGLVMVNPAGLAKLNQLSRWRSTSCWLGEGQPAEQSDTDHNILIYFHASLKQWSEKWQVIWSLILCMLQLLQSTAMTSFWPVHIIILKNVVVKVTHWSKLSRRFVAPNTITPSFCVKLKQKHGPVSYLPSFHFIILITHFTLLFWSRLHSVWYWNSQMAELSYSPSCHLIISIIFSPLQRG